MRRGVVVAGAPPVRARRLIALPLWSLVVALCATVTATALAADPHRIVHGMTVSCQTWGWEWGTDEMVTAMTELRDLGVNWIAIHPYARIHADGRVDGGRHLSGDPQWLTRPITEAHRLGMKILIKPHLAYWGGPFSWRGDITFSTAEQWALFFATYESWITQVAHLTRDADAFCVGTELDRTLDHVDAWRQVIARVRQVTPAPLTYAANWSDFERVAFWDDLDVIGIQAYFPLVDHDALPAEGELADAWSRLLQRIEAYAAARRRQVVFTELGYNLSQRAAREPWSDHEGGPHAELTQRRCLEVALAAIEGSETVCGAFLWKWFAGPVTRENFLKSTPAMRGVISRAWLPDRP